MDLGGRDAVPCRRSRLPREQTRSSGMRVARSERQEFAVPDEKREKLLRFLDTKAFDPVLRKSASDFDSESVESAPPVGVHSPTGRYVQRSCSATDTRSAIGRGRFSASSSSTAAARSRSSARYDALCE